MPNWLDELGDDDLGALEIGDVGFPFRRRRGGRKARGGNARVPMRRLIPQIPGSPGNMLALEPLGLTAVAFTSTSGTLLAMTARPQKPFKPRRLIIDLTRTGASATGLITVSRIDIGVTNCLVQNNPIAVSMFQSVAVDANIAFPPASQGVDIVVQLNISAAPTTTDRVDVGGGFLGETVG